MASPAIRYRREARATQCRRRAPSGVTRPAGSIAVNDRSFDLAVACTPRETFRLIISGRWRTRVTWWTPSFDDEGRLSAVGSSGVGVLMTAL